VLIAPRQIATRTLTVRNSRCLLEISVDFQESVEMGYFHPSYIQARKGEGFLPVLRQLLARPNRRGWLRVRVRFQNDSFKVNSIARGEPRAKTPEPKPSRLLEGCSMPSPSLGVPLIEPSAPFKTPLSGLAGPSKLAKFITL